MDRSKLTKTQTRLLKLFNKIEDENIREIIIEVINIEKTYRSSHNFPIRKVRDVIDSISNYQESQSVQEGES